MDDLIDDMPQDGGRGNMPEFTVSEISGAVKRTIEGGFAHVRVRGEIGRLSRPRSGHVYLDLKDDRSVLSSVIWKGAAARLAHEPEEGMEVVATGRMTTFAGQSKYQLIIEDLVPAGAGALMAMLEKRRVALAAEGLFDEGRKRPIPFLPETIGVITSPSGAVIRDILHRLRDRFPRRVLIWPAAVQGEACVRDVERGIRGFNALPPGGPIPRPDVLIVARGGGSLEDLWGFNDEKIVRAVADSTIPVISAVGHETDTTLIDHAADRRAPTPTAAAEMAVPVRLDLLNWLRQQDGYMTRAVGQAVTSRRQRLGDLARGLPRPETLLDAPRQRLDRCILQLGPALRHAAQVKRRDLERLSARLEPSLERAVASRRLQLGRVAAGLRPSGLRNVQAKGRDRLAEVSRRFARAAADDMRRRHERLDGFARLHATLGYEATLRRGYAVVHGEDGVVKSKAEAAGQARLAIEFADGRLGVVPAEGPARPAPRRKAGDGDPPDQGSLF
ncbi:exodeoxyribonuclease VII large subunit [Roseibacterium sp. SDUM158017]|uniref:exodeoxyribonuclease VII large subunit n=1 Tax=Roseicyclus salinarum TaxID=3036773 RepID=UPI0024156CFD|nr:exodeoxyribonuclease VII large subunit [Roseibacterium sp. SDUM158017]MDG4649953.1 exodeoxyribonuclease VII large subunit [Roseibacterium sp. SDUM158017]